MQSRLARLLLLLLLAVLTLAGCSRRERVSNDYTLVTPESWNPDGHPGTALHYKGKQVWPNVYIGSSNSYHDGVFVFSAPVPTSDGQYSNSVSPQLFAIRGAGPPVIVSQRIIEDALEPNGHYRLWGVTPTESGVRVEFEYWPDHDNKARTNRDVSWPDIQTWVKEAEASTPVTTTPLGTYRLLPPKRITAN